MRLKGVFDVIQSKSAQILAVLHILKRFVNPSLIQLIFLQDEVDSTPSKTPRYPILGKRHECSLCGRNFNRINALKRHVKQVHEPRAAQREYVCNTCVRSFTIQLHFEHMENQHTVDLLRLPNVFTKTTQVGILFCSNIKIRFCVNDKFYVNFLRKA